MNTILISKRNLTDHPFRRMDGLVSDSAPSLAPPLFSTINPAKIQHVASFVPVKHAQVGLFSLFYGPSGGTTGII